MSDDTQGYDIAAVRQLLLAAFADGAELRSLCQDSDALRPVVRQFGSGLELDRTVDEVIDYCRTRLKWRELLAAVRANNPDQYAAFEPRLRAPAAALPASAAPVLTTPFNLPADLDDFMDRETEQAELRRLLDKGSVALISGMGGTGKLALAVHVARQMAAEGHFQDAQLLVCLKGTHPQPLEPAVALGTLLAAVAGPSPQRPAEAEALAGLWQVAMQNKNAVLILASAASAEQVRLLLPGSPSCAVIVTARNRFSLPRAERIDLDSLPEQEARDLLKALVPRLDDAGADEIARLCGRLPMALRVAGNYLAINDDCSVAEYTRRLADVTQLRDPDDPNLDVAATIALSVNQLNPETRRAWALLGLFQAPFDAPAAAALWNMAGELATLDRLRALRNRCLLSYDDETGRWDLQNLLRSAAQREMADAKTVAAAGKRLAHHYLAVAQAAAEKQQFLALDADWPHLRAALEYAAGKDAGLLSDLVSSLKGYWNARGMSRDAVAWCRRAAEACAAAGRRRDEGAHLDSLGSACANLGETQRAIDYHRQALEIARETGDQLGEANSRGGLGFAYQNLGDVEAAIEHYKEALKIARQIRQAPQSEAERSAARREEGNALANLGVAHADLGQARANLEHLQQAIKYHQDALNILHEIGDRQGEGLELTNLGFAHACLGETQTAIDHYNRALDIARNVGDRWGEGNALAYLGNAHNALGDPTRARELWAEALRIYEEIEDPRAALVRGWLAEHNTDSHG